MDTRDVLYRMPSKEDIFALGSRFSTSKKSLNPFNCHLTCQNSKATCGALRSESRFTQKAEDYSDLLTCGAPSFTRNISGRATIIIEQKAEDYSKLVPKNPDFTFSFSEDQISDVRVMARAIGIL